MSAQPRTRATTRVCGMVRPATATTSFCQGSPIGRMSTPIRRLISVWMTTSTPMVRMLAAMTDRRATGLTNSSWTSSETTAAPPMPASSASKNGTSAALIRAVTYAPTINSAGWAKLTTPLAL